MKKLYPFLAILAAAACKKSVPAQQYDEHYIVRGVSIAFRDSASNASLIGRDGQRFLADSVKVSSQERYYNPTNYSYTYSYTDIGKAVRGDDGEWAVNLAYVQQEGSPDDITAFQFNKTMLVRFDATDTDTLLFNKTPGSKVRVFWNTRAVGELEPNDQQLPKIVIRKK